VSSLQQEVAALKISEAARIRERDAALVYLHDAASRLGDRGNEAGGANLGERVLCLVAALAAEKERLTTKFQALWWAARGLTFGEDWNAGTHAKLHGYRDKLIQAVADLGEYDLAARSGEGEG